MLAPSSISRMSFGAPAARFLIGPLFVGHGAQKLFGSFGGHGLEGTGQFFETLGLKPGKRHAMAAGLAETVGGALLTVGALTPVASTVLSSTMMTAIRKVHAANGPWTSQGGWEYNAVLIGAMALLADNGPGKLSVDEKAFPAFRGPAVAALSLAAAAAGSYLATSPRFAGGTPDVPEAEGAAEMPGDPATTADGDVSTGRFARQAGVETPATA
jgi:putative oxidoreductase